VGVGGSSYKSATANDIPDIEHVLSFLEKNQVQPKTVFFEDIQVNQNP
jgi:hypothetical protein